MESEAGGRRGEGGGFGAFEGEAIDYWIGGLVGPATAVVGVLLVLLLLFVFVFVFGCGRGRGRMSRGGIDGAGVFDEEGDGFADFG